MGDLNGSRKELTCGHQMLGVKGSLFAFLDAEQKLALLLCPICAAVVRDSLLRELVGQAVGEIVERKLNDANIG